MNKVLTAIVVTAVALGGTAAFAENAAVEQQAKLAKLWGTQSPAAASQAEISGVIFSNTKSGGTTKQWGDRHDNGYRAER